MGTHETRTPLDSQLPVLSAVFRHPCSLERSSNPAGEMACSFTKLGGQWTVRHNRTDTRHHDGDCSQEMSTEFTKPGGWRRILDFGSWRRTRFPRERDLLIVGPRDDRDPMAGDAQIPQRPRASRGGRGITEQRQNEWMRH